MSEDINIAGMGLNLVLAKESSSIAQSFHFQGRDYIVPNASKLSDEEIHKCLVELQREEAEKNAVTLVYCAGSYTAEAYTDYGPTAQKKKRLQSNKKTPKHKKAKNGRTKKRRK